MATPSTQVGLTPELVGVVTEDIDPLVGPRVILMGDAGTGKTHQLKTLIDAGITPYVLFMEQGRESLMGQVKPGEKWHYKYVRPISTGFSELADMAKKVSQLSYENLSKIQDNYRHKQTGYYDMVTSCSAFVCDCCKKPWGNVSTWKTDRAIVFDGLSGMSDAAMLMTAGIKPTRGQHEWGVAMTMVSAFLHALIAEIRCMMVLIAHEEREKNEITGGTFVTVKTLGQKLAPDIPRRFSDVIRSIRVGSTFSWDTAAADAVTKTRNLPIKSNQEASFIPLIEGWKKKGGKIEVTP